jgi:hypothetical protein
MDIGSDCQYTSNEEISCSREYDLAENNGYFYWAFPVEMQNAPALSSPSCFERTVVFTNEDGSEHSGPFYVDEWGLGLTMDYPYEWVGGSFYGKVEITMQQPISDFTYTLPTIYGSVHIMNSSADPVTPSTAFNLAEWASIYSSHGQTDDSVHANLVDENVDTFFSATCLGDVAEIVIQWPVQVALNTVGVKTDMDTSGSIFTRDTTGAEHYCVEYAPLDGFHRCDAWTDTLVIQK